jgi:hypothetical protein
VPPRGAPSAREALLDIIFLVERLESLIANGKPLPLTKNVIIDREAALNLIDELRVAVPEEVRAAKRINSEGERIIDKAQEEAERIVARAQEQAAFLIDERGLTQMAEDESRRIIAQADQDADDVRRGADDYAVAVLDGLQADVANTLRSIEKGIALLDGRRAQLRAAELPAAPVENGYAGDGFAAEPYADDAAYEDEEEPEDATQPVRR